MHTKVVDFGMKVSKLFAADEKQTVDHFKHSVI